MKVRAGTRDVLLACVWFGLGLGLLALGATGIWAGIAPFRGTTSFFLCTLLGVSAISVLRSRRPTLALTIGLGIAAVDAMWGGSLAVIVILTDLIYSAVKYGSQRAVRMLFRVAAAAVPLCVGAVVLSWPVPERVISALVQWALIVSVAGLWGWNVRSERIRTRAELAQRHMQDTNELRAAVAHDLHDLVANQISVAGLHIEAAKLQLAAPAPNTTALELSLSRAKLGTDRAHEELRRLITALGALTRLDDTPMNAAQDISALGAQLPHDRRLIWIGDSERALIAAIQGGSPARSRLVLRALRECLTNAAKYGVADVSVAFAAHDAPGRYSLTVENQLPEAADAGDRTSPGSTSLGSPSTGMGLRGIRTLLAPIGGTLTVTSDAQRWRTDLEFDALAPTQVPAPTSVPASPSAPAPTSPPHPQEHRP